MAAGKKAGRNSQKANDFLEPKAVTNLSGTDVGTNRAFGNGAVSLTWTLPSDSPAATSYDVTTTPSTTTTNVTTTSATITGLASDTAYTFTVVAKNAAGSSASTTSASVTVTTVPATPSAPSASTVSNQAQDSVSWTAPANGGKAITGYTWASSDGKGGSTASTSVTVSQEAGTAQTYNVYATNANGNSGTSANSGSVTTFSFVPYSFVPYSFVPFSFTPFSFVPYSFVPYSFVPYSFVPTYSFTPYAFTQYAFTPYAFTPSYSFVPLRVCIDEDTLIQVIGADNSVEFKAAKDIVVGDKIWSIHWTGLKDESIDPHAEEVYPEILEGIAKVPSEIIAIDPSVKDVTLFFNGDKGKRFTAEEKVLVKRGNTHAFVEAKTVTSSDSIFEATEDGMVETPVTSVDYIEETRNVFKFNAFPVDTIIAGNMVVHNSKV